MAKTKEEYDIQIKDNGSLFGRYRSQSGSEFTFTLNNRSTGYYALTGTMSMIDPITRDVLKVFDGEELRSRSASLQLHVKEPRAEDDAANMVEREIKRAAQVLEKRYLKQYAQAFRNRKILNEMTFSEALVAYEEDAALQFSKKPEKRKTYINNLKKIDLGAKALGTVGKKTLKAAVEAATDSLAKQRDILSAVSNFVKFVEDKQRIGSDLSAVVEQVLETIKAKIERGQAQRRGEREARNASNSDVLSYDAEKEWNNRALENVSNPAYVVPTMMKGSGLSLDEVRVLKAKQCLRGRNPEMLFLAIKQNYVSATQDYTFPVLPFEARLLNAYLDEIVKAEGPERLAPENYVFSKDGGVSPISRDEVLKVCKQELQRLRFGVADLLGNVDLQKEKGLKLLKDTYVHRLEKYCGVSKDTDEGAWMFLRHTSLRTRVQADHYRGFTGESGRRCMWDYVRQDRRFLPTPSRTRKKLTYRTIDNRREYTMYPPDCENEQQVTITLDLLEGESFWIGAEHGCIADILSYEEVDETGV